MAGERMAGERMGKRKFLLRFSSSSSLWILFHAPDNAAWQNKPNMWELSNAVADGFNKYCRSVGFSPWANVDQAGSALMIFLSGHEMGEDYGREMVGIEEVWNRKRG